ncbi:MAG: hypothetical protein AAF203_10010, partial [Pseudomonadota bacterium]
VKNYIVDMLKHYLVTENLFDEKDPSGRKTRKTMAEMLLTAGQSNAQKRFELLKRLGDSSLYISGFFSDSFQRKIIDVDYYVDMGKMAFESLSQDVDEDTFARVYRELSIHFLGLVDVLSLMSQKAKMMDEENILRMMDVYAKTGSSLMEENLAVKGVFQPEKKQTKQ